MTMHSRTEQVLKNLQYYLVLLIIGDWAVHFQSLRE